MVPRIVNRLPPPSCLARRGHVSRRGVLSDKITYSNHSKPKRHHAPLFVACHCLPRWRRDQGGTSSKFSPHLRKRAVRLCIPHRLLFFFFFFRPVLVTCHLFISASAAPTLRPPPPISRARLPSVAPFSHPQRSSPHRSVDVTASLASLTPGPSRFCFLVCGRIKQCILSQLHASGLGTGYVFFVCRLNT